MGMHLALRVELWGGLRPVDMDPGEVWVTDPCSSSMESHQENTEARVS